MTKIVMQARCIYCKREQYMPAVSAISRGEHPCVWCGKTPPMLADEQDYHALLKQERTDEAE